MNQSFSGRLFRALLPAAALGFFIYYAMRNPQRAPLALFGALLAAAVLYARVRPRRPR